MDRLAKDVLKRVVRANDGEIGQVVDLFFDDHKWIVRYVVVATGSWFHRHRVLLSPLSVKQVDADTVSVNLTREQVEKSPDVMTDLPVSRQEEAHLMDYYGYLPYWTGIGLWGPGAHAVANAAARPLSTPQPLDAKASGTAAEAELEVGPPGRGDPHLRSVREVTGYRVTSHDAELGHVEDFVIDDATFEVHFLILDTGKWRRGKRSIVMPREVERVDWPGHQVVVNVSREALRDSPDFAALRAQHRD